MRIVSRSSMTACCRITHRISGEVFGIGIELRFCYYELVGFKSGARSSSTEFHMHHNLNFSE